MVTWEPAVVHVAQPDFPAVRGIEDGATRDDEWYGFDENPRPKVHVLATVDEDTYQPYRGAMGADHPIVWCRDFDGGRTVYNAMGHRAATWRDGTFLQSILGGIELAAGVAPMPSPPA
jgi:type 1 glutamine amidotransferase